MKELGPHVAPRWYMLAVLLNITKPIIDRISKGFTANENVNYSLSEVVETWLEGINATDHQLALTSSLDPSSSISNEAFKMEASRYWLQIYHVVKRMGYMTFARDLDTKYSKYFTIITLAPPVLSICVVCLLPFYSRCCGYLTNETKISTESTQYIEQIKIILLRVITILGSLRNFTWCLCHKIEIRDSLVLLIDY